MKTPAHMRGSHPAVRVPEVATSRHRFECARRAAGFTLIEVMIVVAILAIFAGIATPNFRELITQNRMTSQANDLLAALQFARSEAITRGRRVSLCALDDTGDLSTECSGSNWHFGWIVFAEGLTGEIGKYEAADDTLLRVQQALQGASTLTGGENITFRPDGTVATARTFTLCPNDGSSVRGRSIPITLSGRARVDKTGSCT